MHVSILSVGTAVPSTPFSQKEMLAFISERFNIRERTQQLYRKVLNNPSIETRHFAVSALDEALDQNLDHKNARFEKQGARLGSESLLKALAGIGAKPIDVDYRVSATCTGYVCPGLSSHLIEACGLKPTVHVADLVGMGCGAAIPAMEQAAHFAMAHPGKLAAVVCTEICSATLVSNDEPDIVISNALFADGSATVLLRCDPSPKGPVIRRFAARTATAWREQLRFVSENGHLKNSLSRDVPLNAAIAVHQAIDDLEAPKISRWVFHAGGQKVLDTMLAEFKLNEDDIACSRTVLRKYGNMSSPTVLFVLDEMLRTCPPKTGDVAAMASFGAGFSAYAALLEWI